MADERVVAARLLHFAHHYAASRGFTFGGGVEGILPGRAEEMAAKVLARASAEGVPEEGMIRLAEGNLTVFIDRMIEVAHATPGYLDQHRTVIGEMTWSGAWSSLCPFWPIC
ncbi:MAG: hypothetical protein MUC89_02280 [Acetobacteraceae bacterium]|jgi:hypothetical protein|nr:hypothetical protein [Acetobacteraceae bacterium]